MQKKENAIWRFFASVKLALISLIILAAISIIGTLIQQGKEPAFYAEEYGANLARIFETLDFTNMYSSWWFVALLALFAINLVVCSIERLPGVWHMVVQDYLATDPGRLEKMGTNHRTDSNLPASVAAERMQKFMGLAGWKGLRRLDRGDGYVLLFAQKGAWTRLGVYLVHLSILVILIGAMVGMFFGFQAYVFLPEGRVTDRIFLRKSQEPVPLGFQLRCDRFEKTYYQNGTVKEFRSDLTVIDPERDTPYQKSIIVNDPLSYGGLTFYQGDAYPLEEYFVVLQDQANGSEQAFRVPANRDVSWQGTDISFRIEELRRDQEGTVTHARIRLAVETAAESPDFWMENKSTMTLGPPEKELSVSFRQFYSTLLLVKKDPGVLTVYVGGILMVIGLAVCFLLSHQRIWVQITPRPKKGSEILFSGASNKNRPAFEKRFKALIDSIEKDDGI